MNETDPPVPGSPIVYSPATFDRHDAAVRYVEGLIQTRAPVPGTGRFADSKPGAWGLLHSGDTISAGSGLMLGSGTVTLCTLDGGTLTDTGQVVTVYNNGVVIHGGAYDYGYGGGTVLALEWTEAGWSACVCSTPCTDCTCGAFCPACGGVTIVAPFHATWTSICGHSGSGDAKYNPALGTIAPIWFTGVAGVDPPVIFRMSVGCKVDGGLTALIAEPNDFGTFFDIYSSTLSPDEVVCTSDTVSGTFTSWTLVGSTSFCFGTPDSLAVTLTIEKSKHRLCCLPSGIPRKDLTLTILDAGSGTFYTGTLTYSSTPTDTWTSASFYVPSIDDTVTISIACGEDGLLCVDVLSSPFTSLSCGGCSGDGSYLFSTSTSEPFHAVFIPAVGSDPGCLDLITYIDRIIIDE